MKKPPKKTPPDRFRDLLGGHGTNARLAHALGYNPSHVSSVMTGERPMQEHWLAVLELLEALPREQWPERWHAHDR
jgi:lambda repressor-like predicted transcriptional regulator